MEHSSSMNGTASPSCTITNFFLHFSAILRKVSTAMSCTPGCFSCMNSNSLSTTVRRNFQCARRKRGYCPTTYMMLDATTALLLLPFLVSHSSSRSLMTVTRKCFSTPSLMVPDTEPMAQHSVFSASLLHSAGSITRVSFSSIRSSVFLGSRCVRNTMVSFITLYSAMTSVSFCISRTNSPASSFSISTSSGLAKWRIMSSRTRASTSRYSSLRTFTGRSIIPPPPPPPTPPYAISAPAAAGKAGRAGGSGAAGATSSPSALVTSARRGSYATSTAYRSEASDSQNSTHTLNSSVSSMSEMPTR